MSLTGGLTEEREATREIQSFCEEVKNEILSAAGKSHVDMFKALKYRSQVVAGTNYFVKIQLSKAGECVHVRLFKPLNTQPGDPSVQLHGVQTGKKIDDPIDYFEDTDQQASK